MKSVSLSWCCTTLSRDIFCNAPLELLSLHIAAIASCKTVCNYHEKFVTAVLPPEVFIGHCYLTLYFLLHQTKPISPHLCEALCLQLFQSSLEQLPRQRFHNLNGQLGSVFDPAKTFFLISFNRNFSCCHSAPLPCSFFMAYQEETSPVIL